MVVLWRCHDCWWWSAVLAAARLARFALNECCVPPRLATPCSVRGGRGGRRLRGMACVTIVCTQAAASCIGADGHGEGAVRSGHCIAGGKKTKSKKLMAFGVYISRSRRTGATHELCGLAQCQGDEKKGGLTLRAKRRVREGYRKFRLALILSCAPSCLAPRPP